MFVPALSLSHTLKKISATHDIKLGFAYTWILKIYTSWITWCPRVVLISVHESSLPLRLSSLHWEIIHTERNTASKLHMFFISFPSFVCIYKSTCLSASVCMAKGPNLDNTILPNIAGNNWRYSTYRQFLLSNDDVYAGVALSAYLCWPHVCNALSMREIHMMVLSTCLRRLLKFMTNAA
jgi:hypothetical protein